MLAVVKAFLPSGARMAAAFLFWCDFWKSNVFNVESSKTWLLLTDGSSEA